MATELAFEGLLGHVSVAYVDRQCLPGGKLHRTERARKFFIMNVPMVNHQLPSGEQFVAFRTGELSTVILDLPLTVIDVF